MGIHLRRPTDDRLERLLSDAAGHGLTYSPTGTTLADETPPEGLTRRQWHTELPAGSFDRAVEALRTWAMHRATGLHVVAEGDVAVGTNVAMAAPLPLGWVDVTCGVVEVIDEADRWGFAYGTLPVHPSRGEEAFTVTRAAGEDGPVRFEVVAASKPAMLMARLGGPITDRMQDKAVRGYLRSMEAIASGQP